MIFRVDERPDVGDFAAGKLKWDILNRTASHVQEVPTEIDLTACPHLKPYSLACLAALGAAGGGGTLLRTPVAGDCVEHWTRVGLPRFFRRAGCAELPPRKTTVPIERLEDGPGTFGDDAVQVWAQQLGGVGAGMAPRLAGHIDEVIINALTHAESKIGCIVAGQAFPRTGKVEITCVDLGQTIKTHLRRNPKYAEVTEHGAAIVRATELGVTGTVGVNRWGDPNSGCGLAELREFCEDGGGEMAILSGDALVAFGPRRSPQVRPFRGLFAGCLVNIRFNAAASGLTQPTADGIEW